MTAATYDLAPNQRIGGFYQLPPKAATTHYIGTLSGDKAGEAVPVTADILIKRIGVVESYSGPEGATNLIKISVDPTKEYGPFVNGDSITDADAGADLFGMDNQTVSKGNGAGARPWIGYIKKVTAAGVFFSKAKI